MEDFWNLESIGITDSPSQSDECALENLSKTVTFADGRYMVTWPWKENLTCHRIISWQLGD